MFWSSFLEMPAEVEPEIRNGMLKKPEYFFLVFAARKLIDFQDSKIISNCKSFIFVYIAIKFLHPDCAHCPVD